MNISQITSEDVIDCWIKTGGRDNGNILYLDVAGYEGTIVWGGYPTLEAAKKVANGRFGWEPEIDPYWIG